MEQIRRSLIVKIIGWVIVTANFLLVVLLYYDPFPSSAIIIPKIISLLSTIGVFPLDFFQAYLGDLWLVHFYWIFTVILCAFGIQVFNKFARTIFIVFSIIHVVVLACMTLLRFGNILFLDYFFKLYFNLVACGAYVGFITIPEVRAQFKPGATEKIFNLFIARFRARASAPRDANSYFNLGIVYNSLERYADAIKVFQQAVGLAPENADFCFHLGLTYIRQKNFASAVGSFKKAMRIDPIHFDAAFNLGLAYLHEGCAKEAVVAFEKAANIKPNNLLVYKKLGESYSAAERFPEAVAAFKKVVAVDRREGEAYYHLGQLYLTKLDKIKEAQDVLKVAVKLKPKMTDAHFQLGVAWLKGDRPKDAIRSFKEVIRLDDTHKQAYYQLGFSYSMIKDFGSARREYKFLKKIDSDLADTLAMVIQ